MSDKYIHEFYRKINIPPEKQVEYATEFEAHTHKQRLEGKNKGLLILVVAPDGTRSFTSNWDAIEALKC